MIIYYVFGKVFSYFVKKSRLIKMLFKNLKEIGFRIMLFGCCKFRRVQGRVALCFIFLVQKRTSCDPPLQRNTCQKYLKVYIGIHASNTEKYS